MTSPDPVPPVLPLVALIVTTEGRFLLATAVASHTLALLAPGVALPVVLVAATMAPPSTPPRTSATAMPAQVTHDPPRRRSLAGGTTVLPCSSLGASFSAIL